MKIDRNNYEMFFLLYVDRELSPSEAEAVDRFLLANPDLQKDLKVLQSTLQRPDQIAFEPKEILFRSAEKRRVVPMYWMRIAAAVMILIAGSWLTISLVKTNRRTEFARGGSEKKQPLNASVVNNDTADKAKTTEVKTVAGAKAATRNAKQEATSNGTQLATRNTKQEATLNGTQQATFVSTQRPMQKGTQPLSNTMDEAGVSAVAVQKQTSTAIQGPEKNTGTPLIAGAALIPAAGVSMPPQSKEIAFAETGKAPSKDEYQSDNAISVVALNDKNKAITGFFRKFSKRPPADENGRKVRVSVFQISY